MRKNREIKAIFAVTAVFFAGFLAVPMISVLVKSFTGNGEAASLSHYPYAARCWQPSWRSSLPTRSTIQMWGNVING